jgi:hypothetical protein
VVPTVSGAVLVEADVEYPVEAVLDGPVGPDGASEGGCVEAGGAEVEAPHRCSAAVAGGGGFDLADHGQPWHAGLVRVPPVGKQPVDVVADPVAPDLKAAVVGVCGGVLAGGLVERVGEPGVDLGPLAGPIVLQGEQPVAALVPDQPGGLALAVQRIAGDQRALEVEQPEQLPGRGDLALLGARTLEAGRWAWACPTVAPRGGRRTTSTTRLPVAPPLRGMLRSSRCSVGVDWQPPMRAKTWSISDMDLQEAFGCVIRSALSGEPAICWFGAVASG